jgi:hypothetical protein
MLVTQDGSYHYTAAKSYRDIYASVGFAALYISDNIHQADSLSHSWREYSVNL